MRVALLAACTAVLVAASAGRTEVPPQNLVVHVVIDGLDVGPVAEVSGLGFERAVEPGMPPGPPRFDNIVIRRGVVEGLQHDSLFEWTQRAANGERTNGKIILKKRDGTPIIEWTFEKGWPSRYEGPRLDNTQGGLAFEAVEIAHEGLKMQG